MDKPTNPLVYSVLGLLILIFGIVNFMLLNKSLGVGMGLGGLVLIAFGIDRYVKAKRAFRQSRGE